MFKISVCALLLLLKLSYNFLIEKLQVLSRRRMQTKESPFRFVCYKFWRDWCILRIQSLNQKTSFFRYDHFLQHSEFPLLRMLSPSQVEGKLFFSETRQKITPMNRKRCMICKKFVPLGHVIAAHDPDRTDMGRPTGPGPMGRVVNHLPGR